MLDIIRYQDRQVRVWLRLCGIGLSNPILVFIIRAIENGNIDIDESRQPDIGGKLPPLMANLFTCIEENNMREILRAVRYDLCIKDSIVDPLAVQAVEKMRPPLLQEFLGALVLRRDFDAITHDEHRDQFYDAARQR